MRAQTRAAQAVFAGVVFSAIALGAIPAVGLEAPVFGAVSMTMNPAAPHDVAVADFNEDGFDDTASAMVTSDSLDSVAVSLGGPDPVLGEPKMLATGGATWSIVTADFNADGHADLAASLAQGAGIVVFFGQGDGTFDEPVTYATSAPVRGLVITDANADGFADIAGVEPDVGSVVLLTGGNGGFSVAEYAVPGAQRLLAIAAGQLAGDTLPDLAVVDNFDSRVLVLENTGAGFDEAASLATGEQPRAVAVADLNGDGVNDVIASSSIASNVEVFFGSEGGAFAAPQIVSVGEDVRTGALAVFDLEGDGDLDVLAANATTGELIALENDGRGHLTVVQCLHIGSGPTAIVMGNPDGDTSLDIIVADYGDACITVIPSAQTLVAAPSARLIPVPNTLETVDVAGADRYATAVAASNLGFPNGAEHVVIVSGENWPDAVTASSLAGRLNGPLLLTRRGALPQAVVAELRRLGASDAVIIGGEAAISASVGQELEALLGADGVSRIAGSDRYDTARMVARRVVSLAGDTYDGRAFVATGRTFADALAAAPLANAMGAPVFLESPQCASQVEGCLSDAGVTDVVILGGEQAVGTDIEAAIAAAIGAQHVTRLAGGNRYETSALVAEYGVNACGLTWNGVGIALGSNFPDALAGGSMLGSRGSVMLLSTGDALAEQTAEALRTHATDVDTVVFFGSARALSDATRSAATSALR